ncbi:MAG: DsrE/DsrF/DrsH-like family protein [Betaproteobacteria bacterium]|nr:DsrE/DsrF/DrsH-like family protein [Betaproteobacteria bacterium]
MSDKLGIILVSETREKLQMAAMVASVGAVSGNAVSVFISMNAMKYFVKGGSKHAPAEGDVGRVLENKKAPAFDELFLQAVELGDAKIYPCSMAMDLLELDSDDLEPYVEKAMGLTRYLDEVRDAQVWTF